MEKKMEKKCPKCGKIHLTEVDKMGVAYRIFCKTCRKSKESENGKGIFLYHVL